MGNCLRNNQISAQDHENYENPVEPSDEAKVEQIKAFSLSNLEAPVQQEQSMKKKKKKVSFKIQNDDEDDRGSHSNSRSGTVRIRLVMTQEELKRILSCKNDDAQHTSLEQLLSVMKLRGRISEVGEYDGDINSWRPALDSIPEGCLIK